MIDHFSYINRRIILLDYVVPATVYVLIFLIISFNKAALDIGFAILLLIIFAVTILLNRKNYLYGLNVSDGFIELLYLDVFLRKKSLQLSLFEVLGIEITKPKLTGQPCSLNLKTSANWKKFLILNAELDKDVKEKLGMARLL